MKGVYAIIQARMAASRLPGKVLLEIASKPMLAWVVERARRAKTLSGVLVATTRDPSDDLVEEFCQVNGYQVERGSDHDVLDRYYQVAKQAQADVIVRITADCPFIDPDLIDEAVNLMLGKGTHSSKPDKDSQGFDFVANRLPPPWGRTYPIGLDVEVFKFDLLSRAWRNAVSRYQREHVAPYFYEDAPVVLAYKNRDVPYTTAKTQKGFRVVLMHHTPNYGHLRWTVDTKEDLTLVRSIASHFPDDRFGWTDVLALVQEKPVLSQINAHVEHKTHLDVDSRST